jgi:hypothetical protein
MHDAAGNQRLITQGVLHIRTQLANPTPEVIDAIGTGIGSNDAATIDIFTNDCI